MGSEDVRVGDVYDTVRREVRRALIESKGARRLPLGQDLVLVLENAETVRGALEEALRAEGITEDSRVSQEAAGFTTLIPPPGELVGVLYLDVADPADLNERAAELLRLAPRVYLEGDGRRTAALLDAPAGAEAVGAVDIRFQVTPGLRQALNAGGPVHAGIEHDDVHTQVALTPTQVAALGADVMGETPAG